MLYYIFKVIYNVFLEGSTDLINLGPVIHDLDSCFRGSDEVEVG